MHTWDRDRLELRSSNLEVVDAYGRCGAGGRAGNGLGISTQCRIRVLFKVLGLDGLSGAQASVPGVRPGQGITCLGKVGVGVGLGSGLGSGIPVSLLAPGRALQILRLGEVGQGLRFQGLKASDQGLDFPDNGPWERSCLSGQELRRRLCPPQVSVDHGNQKRVSKPGWNQLACCGW